MNIVQRAARFVQSLRQPDDARRCRHCGSTRTKKHGFYTRRVCLLRGVRRVRVPRYRCHSCGQTYSLPDRRWASRARYGREVQRKGLDLYFHLGASWRQVAEWLRGEIRPGAGRSRQWCPCRRAVGGDRPGARLSHVTVWRWAMRAGERAAAGWAEGGWAGVAHFSGGVVADATAICIRGVWQRVHLIADGVSRVGMSLERWREEGEAYVAGRFRLWLGQWGIAWQEVKVLVSDGAQVYAGVLARVLRQARQQRCLFHLWRNLLPDLKTYEAEAGQEAGRWVRFLLRLLWAIPTLAEAWVGLEDIERTLGEIPALAEVLRTVRRTLPELWGIVEAGLAVGERTSNVAERFFRRLKQRTRRMGCFMSEGGADHFLAAWLVYANCEPYQVRKERKRVYRHPGQSPLEVGGAEMLGYSWLDLLEV